jgi:membrane protease YdiL (CAAX protease family)
MTDDRTANLFDLRRIIGGVFVLYGVLLVVLGLFDGQEEIDRAAGLNINLLAGLGMLVLGVLFLVWAFARPLSEELGSEEPRGRPGDDPATPGGDGGARP